MSKPLLFYLWVAGASAAFVAGVRGVADFNNESGLGQAMSWVGVSVGGLTLLLLLIAPMGGINVALLLVTLLLAFVALKK